MCIRKTLEERLDLSPMTRRAWVKAKRQNDNYQNELKDHIKELETMIDNKS